MYKSIAIIALTALAAAAPTPGGKSTDSKATGGAPRFNSIQYTATFDDLHPLTQNAALQETGPYDGLDFKGIGKSNSTS